MKRLVFLFFSITVLIVLPSCFAVKTSNNQQQLDIGQPSEKNWEEIISAQQEHIKSLQKRVDVLENRLQIMADSYQIGSLQHEVDVLKKVLYTSDVVDIVTGFVETTEEINGKVSIKIQTAKWLTGEDANKAAMEDQQLPENEVSVPNGFYININNDDVREYELHENSLSYISEQAKLKYIHQNEFLDYLNEDITAYRFFSFYIVNGQISAVVEHYIP